MIVVEGPDLAGKTTLCQELFTRIPRVTGRAPMVRHFTRPPGQFDQYWGYVSCVQRDVIMDRFHMGGVAYRAMDCEHTALTPLCYELVDAAVSQAGGVVVVLCPSARVIEDRWKQLAGTGRREMYSLEQVLRVRDKYREICDRRHLMTAAGEYKFKVDLWIENDAWSAEKIAASVVDEWWNRQMLVDELAVRRPGELRG